MKQNWYADDSACFAKLHLLKEWLDILMIEGPKFGYFPEPDKSYIVIHPDFIQEAQTVFDGMGVQIVTGRKLLGGFIGGKDDTVIWMEKKIERWVSAVHKLSNAAKSQPQAAFVP